MMYVMLFSHRAFDRAPAPAKNIKEEPVDTTQIGLTSESILAVVGQRNNVETRKKENVN
jgi:hypothetical protein